MESTKYAKVVDAKFAVAAEPRRFHSHFCNCFGDCDGPGWGSCLLAWFFPCVAFGLNVTMTFGRTTRALGWALLFLLCLVAPRGSYLYFRHQVEKDPCVDPTQSDSPCNEAHLLNTAIAYMWASLAIFVALVVVGTLNRRNMRQTLNLKYDVKGGCAECCDDTCAWCCFPMGLMQETRTLMANRVKNGEWRGPVDMTHSFV